MHSFNLQPKSSDSSDEQPWEVQGVGPWLVEQLALSVLKRLLAEASQVSSALAVAEADSKARPGDDAGEKP